MPSDLLHPAVAGCRRLFLRDYELAVRIGVHDFEKTAPQRMRFNVDLFVPLADTTPESDDIGEVLDYDFVREVVRKRVALGHIGLQETLVDHIAAQLLAHPLVRAARVASEKVDVYPDCDAVGVEVFVFKEPGA